MCDATHHPRDRRHQVHVPVRVPGERLDPPLPGARGLRADLGRELGETDAAAEEAQSAKIAVPRKPVAAASDDDGQGSLF